MKVNGHRYLFHTGPYLVLGFLWVLDQIIQEYKYVKVIWVQCRNSSRKKWLEFSQNAYLANTKELPKTKCCLVSALGSSLLGSGAPTQTLPIKPKPTAQPNSNQHPNSRLPLVQCIYIIYLSCTRDSTLQLMQFAKYFTITVRYIVKKNFTESSIRPIQSISCSVYVLSISSKLSTIIIQHLFQTNYFSAAQYWQCMLSFEWWRSKNMSKCLALCCLVQCSEVQCGVVHCIVVHFSAVSEVQCNAVHRSSIVSWLQWALSVVAQQPRSLTNIYQGSTSR